VSVSIASQVSSRHWQRNPPSDRERSGAERLHRLGCARQLEAGDTFVQSAGPDARTVQLDVTNAASIAQAAETRIKKPAAGSMSTVAIERG